MLGRVVQICAQVVDPICVVGSPGQTLPDLPESVVIASDVVAGLGPLQGLSAGLDALKDRCDAAFVCSCDLPLLLPAFIRKMVEQLSNHELAIPVAQGRRHPLSAVYRMSVRNKVDRLLQQDRRALRDLVSICDVRAVDQPTLQQVDPDLISLHNINTQEDYDKALQDWLAGVRHPRGVTLRKI